jgi:hypothetical protein
MLGSEVRQIAAHNELLVVNDTAPPIKAAYPPLAVLKQKYVSPEFSTPKVFYLGEIDDDFKFAEDTQTNGKINSATQYPSPAEGENVSQKRTILDDQTLEIIIEEAVEEILDENLDLTETEETKMKNEEEYLTDAEDIGSRVSVADLDKDAEQTENSPVILSKEIEDESETDSETDADALDGLSDDVRAAHRELEARAEMEVSRSIF